MVDSPLLTSYSELSTFYSSPRETSAYEISLYSDHPQDQIFGHDYERVVIDSI